MIQPSALPTAAFHAQAASAPVGTAEAPESGETAAAFSALLGIQLQAATGAQKQIITSADVLAPATPEAKTGPDGNVLQEALPPVSTSAEEQLLPELADPLQNEQGVAAYPALPLVQMIAPPEDAFRPQAPSSHSAPQTRPLAPVIFGAAADGPKTVPIEIKPVAEADGPAPLPRLALAGSEDKGAGFTAESVRTLAPAPRSEMPAAPAATFQPVLTAPQATPTSVAAPPQTHHDFTALVNRLVEARDTALSVRVPQAIAAAIAHSDFGEVSIRFEHRGDGLAVSLSNPDPDFARAVQAAAPAAQANTAGDNGALAQRQDSAGQQHGTGSGNSQQRHGSATNRQPAQQQRDGDQQQPARGGIFA